MGIVQCFHLLFMGGKIDHELNDLKGPYVFKIQEQNFHRLGNLLPTSESTPKFSQLYISIILIMKYEIELMHYSKYLINDYKNYLILYFLIFKQNINLLPFFVYLH